MFSKDRCAQVHKIAKEENDWVYIDNYDSDKTTLERKCNNISVPMKNINLCISDYGCPTTAKAL